ncbi:MAG: hypothetical protein AAFQ35_05655 [Pseudomonadota bacterium]
MTYTRSKRRLARDIERRRDRIENNLELLGDKFSLDGLLSQAGDMFSGFSGGGRVSRAAKSNGLPMLLLSAGATWLAANQARRWNDDDGYDGYDGYDDDDDHDDRSDRRYARARAGYRTRVYSGAPYGSSAYRKRGYTSSRDRDFYDRDGYGRDRDYDRDHRDNQDDEDGSWSDRMSEKMDAARARGRRKYREGREYAAGMRRSAKRRARRAYRSAGERYNENPLGGGLIALAIGAALGAMLPPTRREDELFGSRRDELRDRLGEEAHALYDETRETVKEKASSHSDAFDEDDDDASPAYAAHRVGKAPEIGKPGGAGSQGSRSSATTTGGT